jgi:hypothetical protein
VTATSEGSDGSPGPRHAQQTSSRSGGNPDLCTRWVVVGAVIGLLAGAYPAIRAATTEPITALRRAV